MAYPPISALPSPPSRQDPANFADEADAFLGALPTFQTETNTAGTYIEGKAAEADLIIGIGKETEEGGSDNGLRHIYVSKNKLGGKHGTCTTVIKPEISRYVD